jgi:diketogulonate reductase-like aldo/keto reductase
MVSWFSHSRQNPAPFQHGYGTHRLFLRFQVLAAPIVGTTSLKHLLDAVQAVHLKLTEEEVKYLEEPYTPRAVLGH